MHASHRVTAAVGTVLLRTTITGNAATSQGGGVSVRSGSSLLVEDSTILDNPAPDGADGFVVLGGLACPVATAPLSWSDLKVRFEE